MFKSGINPSLTVYERYNKVNIINPYRLESLTMKSVSLNGTSQYLTLPTSSGLELTSAFTGVCWFRTSNISANGKLFALLPQGAQGDARGWQIDYNASTIRGIIGDGDGSFGIVTSAASYSSNTWYCVIMTYNGSQIELFVNNTSIGTASENVTYVNGAGAWPPSKIYWIGATDTSAAGLAAGFFLQGEITGCAIFNTALDSYQRSWIYNSGQLRNYAKADFYSNCVMYLPFNDSYDDYTGNGYNSTAVNSPTFSTDIPN